MSIKIIILCSTVATAIAIFPNSKRTDASDLFIYLFTIYIAELQVNINFYSEQNKMVAEVFSTRSASRSHLLWFKLPASLGALKKTPNTASQKLPSSRLTRRVLAFGKRKVEKKWNLQDIIPGSASTFTW